MNTRTLILTLCMAALLGPVSAPAEQQFAETAIAFEELSHGEARICYAIIEVPDGVQPTPKTVDLRFADACAGAFGKLTLGSISLWPTMPPDWDLTLDPEWTQTGLFFPLEADNTYHAEIGGLFMDGVEAGDGVVLALTFECGDVDCHCSRLIENAVIRFSVEEQDSP